MHILSFATGKATDHMALTFKIRRVILTRLVLFFRIKESSGWQEVFSSPYLDRAIERVALNAKVVGGPHGDKDKMVAASSESSIILWSIQDGGSGSEIGRRTEQICASLIWLDLKNVALSLWRCVQSWSTSWLSVLHWESAGRHQSHGEGGSVERCHPALAGKAMFSMLYYIQTYYQGSYLITSFAMQHLYRCRMWCPSRAATLLAPSSCWAVTTAQFTILVSCLSSPGLHWIYFYLTWVINEMCNRLYQSQCWKCNYNCIKASM